MPQSRWHPRLTDKAERDLKDIIRWTRGTFGNQQASIYREVVLRAIRVLENGPEPIGSKRREDLSPGLRMLHVTRGSARGRHFLLFRVSKTEAMQIDVVRILHDTMDFARHLPEQK